jgi:hypothetical protein
MEPQSTRALFVVNDLLERKDKDGKTTSVVVRMNPSYENGVNRAFFEATPTGHLEMTINNPAAFSFFRPGQKFWLDFTPAE